MPAIGTVKCIVCTRDFVVKQSDKGALNLCCPHCDVSLYAKEGTEAKKLLMPRVKLSGEPTPTPTPTPAPAAKPKQKMPWDR